MSTPETPQREKHAAAIRRLQGWDDQGKGSAEQALPLEIEAVNLARENGNSADLAEMLGSLARIYKRLARETKKGKYIDDALAAATESVKVARTLERPFQMLPLRDLAGVYADREDGLPQAIAAMQEAIEIFHSSPPESHVRESIGIEMEGHLASYQYRNAQSAVEKASALEKIDVLLKRFPELRNESDGRDADDKLKENPNELDIRESGLYLEKARLLLKDDKDEGLKALAAATGIIESRLQDDPRMNDLADVTAKYQQ